MKKLMRCLVGLLVWIVAVEAKEPNFNYVVKVTPSLVYLDGGRQAGVAVDNHFVIVRPKPKGDDYQKIAEVSVLRIFEKMAIAEIRSTEQGQEIEVLDFAVREAEWREEPDKETASIPEPYEMLETEPVGKQNSHRKPLGEKVTLYAFGGYQQDRGTDIRGTLLDDDVIPGVADDAGFGTRLGFRLTRSVQMNFSYKYAGLIFDPEEDLQNVLGQIKLTQNSFELDVNYFLFPISRFSPYLGLGAGIHHLIIEGEKLEKDTTNKWGFNFLAGARLSLILKVNILGEIGYQYVYKGDGKVDFSNYRAFAGLGYSLFTF